MGFEWDVPPDEAFGQLADDYATAVHREVGEIVDRYAPQVMDWMKSNAPWTDRTGKARETLNTEVFEVVNEMVALFMSHGVSYGVF